MNADLSVAPELAQLAAPALFGPPPQASALTTRQAGPALARLAAAGLRI